MPFVRAQVSLERDGAVPADAIVNTWHFDGEQTLAQDADDLAERLRDFYIAIQQWMSAQLSGNGLVKVYNLEDGLPRVPVYQLAFSCAPASAGNWPMETALCLSFRGAQEAGANAKRRRGRVYLPCNGTGVQGAIVGGDVSVLASARNGILAAAAAMAHGPDAGDFRLAVFSPTEAGAPQGANQAYTAAQLGPAFEDVTDLWIDDRFDTVRKRGSKPTARSTAVPT